MHGEILTSLTLEQGRKWLDSYSKAKSFFEDKLNKRLFIFYGTLLGYARDRSLIPHDDDFDAAYWSDYSTPLAVKEEMIEILARVLTLFPTVHIHLLGFFFKLRLGGDTIDIFPCWHDGQRLWVPWATSIQCAADLLKEQERVVFLEKEVYIPKGWEEFLSKKYGDNWRTPDPGYRDRRLNNVHYSFDDYAFTKEDLNIIVDKAYADSNVSQIGTITF